MGVVIGFGGGIRLIRIIGWLQVFCMLCFGKVYRVEESKDMGLVDDILLGKGDSVEEVKDWIKDNFFYNIEMIR